MALKRRHEGYELATNDRLIQRNRESDTNGKIDRQRIPELRMQWLFKTSGSKWRCISVQSFICVFFSHARCRRVVKPRLSYFSLRTQTYFRLSLVSAENNFCEPEPGNDFRDVGILSQSQSSSSCLRTTARGICCEEHSSFILSWNLIGQGETKVVTSQKSFLTQNSQQTWTSKFS